MADESSINGSITAAVIAQRLAQADKDLSAAILSHIAQHVAEEKAMNLAFDSHLQLHTSNDKALDKANEAMLARLESMNEFRAQITQERGTYVARVELSLQLSALFDRIDKRDREVDVHFEKMNEDFALRLNVLAGEYNRRVSALEIALTSVQPVSLSVAENSRRLNVLENVLSNFQGRTVVIGGVLSLIPILISIGLHFLR